MMFYSGNAFPERKGNVFVGGLNTMRLVRLVIEGDRVVGKERLFGDVRRRRSGSSGASARRRTGSIYLLTNV
jgi:glucose/arabinose dehydrogenase